MTTFEQKRLERIEKARIKRQTETEEFLSSVNVVYNYPDSGIVGIVKETDKCYLDCYISKYPNCLKYKLAMKKKEHPFDIYYSKEYYKEGIPKKYKEVFEELEQNYN